MTRGELYLKLDVNYSDNAKIVSAGPDAELVYIRGLCLAKRLITDGFIHKSQAALLARGLHTDPDYLAATLCEHGLWESDSERDGWVIHGFLDHNLSKEEIEASRAADADRKKASRRTPAKRPTGHTAPVRSESKRTPSPRPPDSLLKTESVVESLKENKQRNQPRGAAAPPGAAEKPKTKTEPPGSAQWQLVVEAYQVHHPQAKPGAKERRLYDARRKEGYSVDQILDAIAGCHASGFHKGQNDRGRKYQGLHLILRDSSRVQEFLEACPRREVASRSIPIGCEPLEPGSCRAPVRGQRHEFQIGPFGGYARKVEEGTFDVFSYASNNGGNVKAERGKPVEERGATG